MSAERRWHIAAWIVCAVFAALAMATFTDYGITWDEQIQHEYGERVLRYYLSGFRDHSHDSLFNLPYYGPLFETIAAAISRVAPQRTYGIRHSLIALTGLLTLIAVMRIAARFGGAAAGFFATLFLVLTPHFYGATFNNSKDIPFACGVAWSIWAAARFLRCRSFPSALICGLILGLTMAIRVGGLFLLVIIAAAAILTSDRQQIWIDAKQLAAMAACAWIVMVLLWPWALASPITHPLEALQKATSFTEAPRTLFEGVIWRQGTLPLRYLPKMFALTTPLVILGLTVVGCGLAAITSVCDRDKRGQSVLILLWVGLPLAVYFVRKPPVYDGIRHFLFLLPAMAILAAMAVERLRKARFGTILAVLVVISLTPTAVAMMRLHPYQSTYYNVLAGGMEEASQRYETDYWVSSYREAMLWVNAHRCSPVTKVLLAMDSLGSATAATYAAENVEIVMTTDEGVPGSLPPFFHYYIATTRFGYANNFPDTPVAAVIGRQGATFTIIRGGCP